MIERERILQTFLKLARISSPSGHEEQVAAAITAHLANLGVACENDEHGNLLARVPGVGEPLLLTAHMDTVVPCDHVQPVVRDGVVYSDGSTILGGDDKAGVAIILEVVEALLRDGVAHRPLELLFTVREEIGLEGARLFDKTRLQARQGIGLDAGGDAGIIVGSAPSQDSLFVTVRGRTAHAGAEPENGINAIVAAARAVARMPLGRIDAETTANIGVIQGGAATNIVPDCVTLRGEARSRDAAKLAAQTQAMVAAFHEAAAEMGATAEVEVQRRYDAYRLTEETPTVQLVMAAMRGLGITPRLVPTGGGTDGNILNLAGIETVQISAGMDEVHTTHEHVAVDDMVQGAELLLACVRA